MNDFVENLRRIAAQARQIVSFAESKGVFHRHTAPAVAPAFEVLPLPNLQDVRATLEAAELPRGAVAGSVAAYEKACLQWKAKVEAAFDRAALTITPDNLPRLALLRRNQYVRQVERWHAQVMELPSRWKAEMEKQRQHIGATMDGSKPPRPKFHSEYTPLLELYFRFNAYPTFADRRVLAKKTGMLTRQITVWFQNHRRRAKGPLPRMSPLARVPMEEFERERERIASKLVPVLVPPHLRPLPSGSENAVPSQKPARKSKNSNVCSGQSKPRKDKPTHNAQAGPSYLLKFVLADKPIDPAPKKKSKKSKAPAQDVVMADATAIKEKKEKRRKLKKLPRAAGQMLPATPMDVDRNENPKQTKKSHAFDSAAELAFAKAAYPTPSKYAYVHTRKSSMVSSPSASAKAPSREYGHLGLGKPSAPSITPTVPPHRVSSRLNAMRPPYAFPAPYNPAAVPLTFVTAQSAKFSFSTDSQSFGFKKRRTSQNAVLPPVSRASMHSLVSHFAGLRLLCAGDSSSLTSVSTFEHSRLSCLRTEGLSVDNARGLQTAPDSYAARRAITYVPPKAPLESAVSDLRRALQQRLVSPMILATSIVQPDAFAPFVALAERRAKRRARKEKKRQEEKQAKKDKKERKKASLAKRAPSSSHMHGASIRASSVASEVSASPRKAIKKARKSTDSASSSSRASSVASSARTPSLSSISSRRSSDMSMPGTPRADQSLPIVAASDFDLGGGEDVDMSTDLMAQLFGVDDASSVGQMHSEEFTPDMLTFSSTASSALSDMTADVNMPELGNIYVSQQNTDDMGWAASLGLGAQDPAPLGSFGNESNVELDWLLDQNLLGDTQMSDLCCTAPTASSQINIHGSTYQCELGGPDNINTSFDFNDWTFGLGACDDGFAGLGQNLNLLGGTAVAV
ncbi:hypothetical protein K525DRAFT_184591 [Schizophyllum commune Loenen D]|nr:hypothetical protein K525DRAFT_184591 [Schizophyllum commune Loenen D]